MPNPFAHIELTTDDLKSAQKFYGKVFAWSFKDVPNLNYTMIDVSGGTGGGIQLKPAPDAPTGWMPYVQVTDVKATLAKAVKAGATAVLPYQEIGEMGSIGVFADPNGSVIGVWAEKADLALPAKKAGAEKPASEQAVAKKPVAERARGKKPAAEQPVAKKPTATPAATKKAAGKQPAAPAKKAPTKKSAPTPTKNAVKKR